MKFLLILVVVVFGVWLWRRSRLADKAATRPPAANDPEKPQEMQRCAWCQVHLPRADMVDGQHGLYCCAEHRQRAES